MTAGNGNDVKPGRQGVPWGGGLSRGGILGRIAAIVAFPALLAVSRAGWLHLPPCPFRLLTGLSCPGCGTTRAFHAMAHGEILAAVRFNPTGTLLFCALLFVLLMFAVELCTVRKLRVTLPATTVRAGLPFLLGLWLGFGMIRMILELGEYG